MGIWEDQVVPDVGVMLPQTLSLNGFGWPTKA